MRKIVLQASTVTKMRYFIMLLLFTVSTVLIKQTGSLLANNMFQDGKITVTGTVAEAESGTLLPGVSILVKGTTEGTITNIDGKYTIEVASSATLVYSYVGYLTEEVPVNAKTVIDVNLVTDFIGLNEVVVMGYGVQKKSDLTGAVASVSGDKLTEMPVTGIDQALQGRAAGVNVSQATGLPGGKVNFQIRGITSINGADPLVIVDGVPSSVDALGEMNPADIESIEILKDASSAAIYGVSGGNGVILITTKGGKEGEMVTNVSYYRGWSNPWKNLDIMNSQEYAELMNIIRAMNEDDPFTDQPDTLENHDYQDLMLRTAIMESFDVSVSGGSEKSTFFASTSLMKEEGILRNSDFQRMNFSLNSEHKLSKLFTFGENAGFRKTKNVGWGESELQNEYNTPIVGILQMPPYVTPYQEDGTWTVTPGGLPNAVVSTDVLDRERNKYAAGGNAFLKITPFKGFVFNSVINGYYDFIVTDRFRRIYNYSATIQQLYSQVDKEIENYYGWQWQNYINYNTQLAENHNIGITLGMESGYDKFTNIYGFRKNLLNESEEMRYFAGSTNNTDPDQIVSNNNRYPYEDAKYSYFGRLNYDYRSKYLLTVNVRRDASSRFGPDKRTGTFPSFSVGWKFSEEPFVKNLGVIDFGKIRFGYGEVGANAATRFAYSPTVAIQAPFAYPINNTDVPANGAFLTNVANPEMAWETVVMSNFGIDLGFLKNKLSLTVDYFHKENQNMLIYVNIPSYIGFYQATSHVGEFGNIDARPFLNAGSMVNKGVEVQLGYKKKEGSLTGSFDLNFTYVTNEVKDLGNTDSMYRGQSGVNLNSIALTCEGYPVSQFNGFQTNGLFTWADAALDEDGDPYIWNQPFQVDEDGDTTYAQPLAVPGDFRFVDANNDGAITDDDRVNIGNPNPKVIIGFSTTLEYKNFDLNIFLDGKFGHKIFNGSKVWLMYQNQGGTTQNGSVDMLDQYREAIYAEDGTTILYEAHTDTDLPRLDPRNRNRNLSRPSDFYVESGNYLRLKNVQLGYTLPTEWSGKIGVEKFRVYIGVKNLLTFTKYSGFDPEVAAGRTPGGQADMLQMGIDRAGNYPHSRTFLVGANLQF